MMQPSGRLLDIPGPVAVILGRLCLCILQAMLHKHLRSCGGGGGGGAQGPELKA